MSVVQVENVYKEYTLGEQQVHALEDITLSVDDGAFLAIAGPSGSGKSTLLNLIGCIDSPTRGRILINGQDVSGRSPDQLADLRARTIGFIFQTFNLFPVLSARENVEYPLLHLREMNASERRDRVDRYLGIVGLSKFSDHRPNQLSGGQRQRVAIARALATKPKIVLADEPTANLDHATGNGILQLMQDINRQFATTFIFSTHDQRVMTMADRLVRIEDGRLLGDDQESVKTLVAATDASRALGVSASASTEPAAPGRMSDAVAVLRAKINNFLYIDQAETYMTAPWHINTDTSHWVVSRSSVEIGDADAFIRAQIQARVSFYAEFHKLVSAARSLGVQVEGWPLE